MGPISSAERPRVALVLPGGGARGAYEAGALATLLAALEARGERVSIVCGTSVGAINAAAFAAMADRPAHEIVEHAISSWLSLRKGGVFRPVVGPGIVSTAARGVAEVIGIPGVVLSSLLDPRPLTASLDRWIDWDALGRSTRAGELDAVCVVATSLRTGQPTAFVQMRGAVPQRGVGGGMRYEKVRLASEHVRASAAMPLLFPPVAVERPVRAAGHYIDGATRLNTPLSPALALGADRVIVIGFRPLVNTGDPTPDRRPRMSDVIANMLDGLLVDQVRDDIHQLAAINSFFSDGIDGTSPSARARRRSRGRPPYRRVAYALVAPEETTTLGDIAERVLREKYGWRRTLTDPDYPLLARLLDGGRRGEMLSFLFFDPDFAAALIAQGRADAQRWLDRHPRFWCSVASHDLDGQLAVDDSVREEAILDEWRAVRRR